MAMATSSPPAPMASMETPAAPGVWLSEPIMVSPGRPKRSICTWWETPLPGAREMDAVAGAGGLQVLVVVGVLVVGLQQVVVDVLRRQLDLHPVESEGLELEHGHGAGGILQQGMVDGDADLLAGDQLPVDQVFVENLVCQVFCHDVCSLIQIFKPATLVLCLRKKRFVRPDTQHPYFQKIFQYQCCLSGGEPGSVIRLNFTREIPSVHSSTCAICPISLHWRLSSAN